MLKVESISVGYGNIQVLWNISFEVASGSITGIVGSNGAGKSTILNAITGLNSIMSGDIKFNGKSILSLTPAQRVELGISLIPERRRLFPLLTVQENLDMGAYCGRARKISKETLEWVDNLFPILRERKKQMAGTLSGGEQQMLAIARSLMSKPTLLMLDEPSVGLSPKITLEVFKLVRDISATGVTVLIMEQNVHHTLNLANNVYVLETGRIVMQGTGKELANQDYIRKAYLGL